jgi:hypothetical protein
VCVERNGASGSKELVDGVAVNRADEWYCAEKREQAEKWLLKRFSNEKPRTALV